MYNEPLSIFKKSFFELKGRKVRSDSDDYEEGDKFWFRGMKYEKVDRNVAVDTNGQAWGFKPNDAVRAE